MLGRKKPMKRSRWKRRPPKDPLPPERRRELYARDNHRCIHCLEYSRISPQHVVKRSQGGTHDLDNLITLCKGPDSCHDRADNYAAGFGKLHNKALGDQRFYIMDERVGRAYIYDGKTRQREWV